MCDYDILDKLIDNNLFGINKAITIKTNYDNIFGVFVTIFRNSCCTNELNNNNVHGCIGYWNNNFKLLTNDEILEHVLRVGHDATHNDSRKNNFKKSIKLDLCATYEISLMKKPLMEIDSNGYIKHLNKYFDNREYGIIVTNNNGNKATFLPNVFKNVSWKYISNSLLNKANISLKTEKIYFYAYNTLILKRTLIEKYLLKKYLFFISKYLKKIYHMK